MREGLRRYFEQKEAERVFLRRQATEENVRAARADYGFAAATLATYKRENPQEWEEFLKLHDAYFSTRSQSNNRQGIEDAQRRLETHPAWQISCQHSEAAAHFAALRNAARENPNLDHPT